MNHLLPIGQILIRARNAKASAERHHCAFYAGEAAIKLAAIARICLWRAHPGPDDHPVWALLAGLERASLGHYVRLLRECDADLRERGIDHPLVAGQEPQRLNSDAVAALVGATVQRGTVSADVGRQARKGNSIALFGLWVAYRNEVLGHGAWRTEAFYEAMGPLLLDALDAALADPWLFGGLRLDQVDGVLKMADIPLGPLLVARGEDLQSAQFAFLNRMKRRRNKVKSAFWLDYISGEAVSEPADVDGVGAWFATLPAISESVDEEDADQVGDFKRIAELGRGAMGVVHHARQLSLDRPVALKELTAGLVDDEVARARFAREVSVLARSDHPNVVKVLTSGEKDGVPWYAMEFVDGADLSTLQGHFSAKRWAALFADAADGLHHLHEKGIVHRDVKPSNLMLTRDGNRIVVMDLGLASVSDATTALTRTEISVLGTLRYMPPEQITRLTQIDGRADVYALGATLYELIGEAPLHNGETEAQLIHQILKVDANYRTAPGDLGVILQKATEKDPIHRYASAAALAADLRAYSAGEPISARPPSAARRLRNAVRRHPAIAGGLLTLTAVLSLATGLYWDANRTTVAHYISLDYRAGAFQGEIPISASLAAGAQHAFRVESVGNQARRISWRPGSSFTGGEWTSLPAGAAPAEILLRWDDAGRISEQEFRNAFGNVTARLAMEWTGENTVRIRYLTPFGIPAENPANGVEVIEQTLDDNGRVVLERYWHRSGRRQVATSKGHWGAQTTYDDQGRFARKTLLDREGRPVNGPRGFSATTYAYLDPDNPYQPTEYRYFDVDGKPAPGPQGAHLYRSRLDASGNQVEAFHFGVNDEPVLALPPANLERHRETRTAAKTFRELFVGCHILERQWDDRGRAVVRRCLDETGKLIVATSGYAENRNTWDGDCLTDQSYFDADGKAAVAPSGYARRIQTCQAGYRVKTQTFFDAEGHPTTSAEGVPGERRTLDDGGMIVSRTYIDHDGNPVDGPSGFAIQGYDVGPGGLRQGTFYKNAAGEPVSGPSGWASARTEHDDVGRHIRTTFLDADGNPTYTADGTPVVTNTYDADGNTVEMAQWDANSRPTAGSGGFHKVVATFDENGNRTASSYFGPDMRPVFRPDGYHRREQRFDEHGRLMGILNFGIDGEPVANATGVHRREWKRNERGEKTEERSFGLDGPTTDAVGVHAYRFTYDDQGREIKREALDMGDRPMLRKGTRWHAKLTRFDAGRQVSGFAVLGVDSEPTTDPLGVYEGEFERGTDGQIVRETYRGPDGKPSAPLGYATLEIERDSRGQPTALEIKGPDGAAADFYGVARVELEWNAAGDLASRTKRDPKGRLVDGPSIRQHPYSGVGDELPRPLRGVTAAKTRHHYDEEGRAAGYSLYRADDAPTAGPDGVHRVLEERSGTRALLARATFGIDGLPLADRHGVYRTEYAFDARGKSVEITKLGPDGELLRRTGVAAIEIRVRDERGRVVESRNLDADRQPLTLDGGYAIARHAYEQGEKPTTTRYFDARGEPVLHRLGYHRVDQGYGWQRKPISEAYFGLNEEPVLSVMGHHRVTYQLDLSPHSLEDLSFGVDGEPVENARGYHRVVRTVHRSGVLRSEDFYGVDGQPAKMTEGEAHVEYPDDPRQR